MSDTLAEFIKSRKPNISAGSLKTYRSLLSSLFKARELDIPEGIESIKHSGDTMQFINEAYADRPLSTRKTLLAALNAVEPSVIYFAEVSKMSNDYKKQEQKQEKTEKQEENWMNFKQVTALVKSVEKDTKELFKSKTPLVGSDLLKTQNYVILCLTTGVFIHPRRSLDWVEMRLRNPSESNNYMKKMEFVFKTYKTAAQYGEQEVDIPPKLRTILNKWKKLNPYDALFVNMDGSPITGPRLTQILNRIFQRNISTSMLRHIYITDKLEGIPALQDMQSMAEGMGHSVHQQMEYVKR
jgi:integrase